MLQVDVQGDQGVPASWSANRKQSGVDGGISPVKWA